MGISAPSSITPFEGLDQETGRVRDCKSESELDARLRSVFALFEVESYLFLNLRRLDTGRECFRCLVGCSPIWSQLYVAKNWYCIDPFIQHALRSTRPIAISAVIPDSAGQTEFLNVAAEKGFRRGIIVPAHTATKSGVGVLCMGTDKESEAIETQLLHSQCLLPALALEVCEWWEERVRAEMLSRYQLDMIDLELLRFQRAGYTTEEAAKACGFTESLVNGRFRRINEKLDVHHKKRAAERAAELGILRS